MSLTGAAKPAHAEGRIGLSHPLGCLELGGLHGLELGGLHGLGLGRAFGSGGGRADWLAVADLRGSASFTYDGGGSHVHTAVSTERHIRPTITRSY